MKRALPTPAEAAKRGPRDVFNFPAGFAAAYASAPCFPHGVLDGCCDEQLLRAARTELLALPRTCKETDLFKLRVHADEDLGSISLPPSLGRVAAALYLPETRRAVHAATGLPDGVVLGDRVDLAATLYKDSGRLLCHDAIGTRAVSFILYLPDPDVPWTLADGGELELFAFDALGAPAVRLAPVWNRAALFNVQSGVSWHAVANFTTSGKEGLALQGWYHAECVAGLTQLQAVAQAAAKGGKAEAAERSRSPRCCGEPARLRRPRLRWRRVRRLPASKGAVWGSCAKAKGAKAKGAKAKAKAAAAKGATAKAKAAAAKGAKAKAKAAVAKGGKAKAPAAEGRD